MKRLSVILTTLSLVWALSFSPLSHAGSNDALMKLVDALEKNGTLDSQTAAALREAAAGEASTDAKVSLKGGKLKVQSHDGDFELKLNGRLMVDHAFYDSDAIEHADSDDTTRLRSGTEVRRARIAVGGKLWKHWKFKTQYEFAGDSNSHLRDAYLAWVPFKALQITVGHHQHPFSMQEQTSSKYISFLERSMVNVLVPGRGTGVSLQYVAPMWRARAGAFLDTTDSGEGSNAGADEDPTWEIGGRFNITPLHGKGQLVHLGVGLGYRMMEDGTSVRVRARPDSHVTGLRLIDSKNAGGISADDFFRYGFEGAFQHGPFAAMGEYIAINYNSDMDDTDDPTVRGFYAQAMYLLTGESRAYSRSSGAWKGVKPNSIVGKGGIGAWELALRYSNLDLSDVTTGDTHAGEQNNLSVGLNWYPTPTIALKADYTQVLDVDGGKYDGADPNIFQLRAQYEF